MEIKNAKIKNVTLDFYGAQDFGARLELETQYFRDTISSETISFNFCDSYDLELFKKVREYTGAKKVNEMNGKIIRLVYFSDIREAFGDAIQDKFVYLCKLRNESKTVKELSESDLKAKYDKLSRGEQ